MRIEELSVGDWVMVKGEVANIWCLGVTPYGFAVEVSTNNASRKFTVRLEVVEPIPLTPEILEKNGFEESSKYCWRNSAIGCTCLRLGAKYWDIRIKGRNRAYRPTRISIDNILHTHQLQNALRLAGVEKEIEL